MAISRAGARRKGRDFERRCAQLLRSAGADDVDASHGLVEVGRPRAFNGVDVTGRAGDVGLAIQCKIGGQPSVWRALEEAQRSADGSAAVAWVLRHAKIRGRRPGEVVAMDVEGFLRLVEAASK